MLVQMTINYTSDVEIGGIQMQLLRADDNETVIIPEAVNGDDQGKKWDIEFHGPVGVNGLI